MSQGYTPDKSSENPSPPKGSALPPPHSVTFSPEVWLDIMYHSKKLGLEPQEFISRSISTYIKMIRQLDTNGDGEVRFYEPRTLFNLGARVYGVSTLKKFMGLE
jgi:hypothetical protein